MGWSVPMIDWASLPEFFLCFRGWQRANGINPDGPTTKAREPMGIAEAEDLFAKYAPTPPAVSAADDATVSVTDNEGGDADV